MKPIPYLIRFNVGGFTVEADGSGEVLINDPAGLVDSSYEGGIALSIDELREVSDKAYAHKIAWEDAENDARVFENVKKGYVNFFANFFKDNPNARNLSGKYMALAIRKYADERHQIYLDCLNVDIQGKDVNIELKDEVDGFDYA